MYCSHCSCSPLPERRWWSCSGKRPTRCATRSRASALLDERLSNSRGCPPRHELISTRGLAERTCEDGRSTCASSRERSSMFQSPSPIRVRRFFTPCSTDPIQTRRRSNRAAFTLLEVLAALLLAGPTLLGAVLLLDQVRDSQSRIARDSAYAAHTGNGERLLSELLLNTISGADTTQRFRGDSTSVSFWSACDVASGWKEPCDVTLAVDDRGDSAFVMAMLRDGVSLRLRRAGSRVRFRYIESSARDTTWRAGWTSNAKLPAALAVVSGSDTLVLPIGFAQ